MSNKHVGVTCNGCSRRDFRFRRYKCLICRDYDLCGTCFDSHQETEKHLNSHPMQCLITKADHDTFYCGESTTKYCVQSFTCSVCGQLGFTESSLSSHVFSHHSSAIDSEVLCPFCAIQTEGDPNRTTHDIASHFKSVHNLQPPINCKSNQSSCSSNHSIISSSDIVSLRTGSIDQSISHGRFGAVTNANTITSQNHRLLTNRSCCHNPDNGDSNHIMPQPLLSNSRFTPGCIVAMKNYLKSCENFKNTCHDDTNGLLMDQPTDVLHSNDEISRNSSGTLQRHHGVNESNSKSETNKLKEIDNDENNQYYVTKTQENTSNDCTPTVSVSEKRKLNDSLVPSITDQIDIPNIDSNNNLDSVTAEAFDHKMSSTNDNSLNHSKSPSGDLNIRLSGDEKPKESNKKSNFISHCTVDPQSSVAIQDEWDIDWHIFLNELIWSSLCSNEVPSTVT
ncbi:E3 ubiquitin-protein ligase [Schistosoma japonicum]|nr:E3 ubiquitin-protein ligase [Schistosoma japonicum]